MSLADSYTQKARADALLRAIERDAALLRGQLQSCVGRGPRLGGVPVWFDAVQDVHNKMQRALDLANRATGYPKEGEA